MKRCHGLSGEGGRATAGRGWCGVATTGVGGAAGGAAGSGVIAGDAKVDKALGASTGAEEKSGLGWAAVAPAAKVESSVGCSDEAPEKMVNDSSSGDAKVAEKGGGGGTDGVGTMATS